MQILRSNGNTESGSSAGSAEVSNPINCQPMSIFMAWTRH